MATAKKVYEEAMQLEQFQKQRQQWQNLLLTIQTVEAYLTAGAGLFYGVIAFVSQLSTLITVTELVGLHFFLTLITVFILRLSRKNPRSRLLEVATVLAVLSFQLDIGLGTLVLGSYSGITAMFFWPPILVTVLGLSSFNVISTTIVSIVGTTTAVFLQSSQIVIPKVDIAKEWPVVNAFFWAITLLMVMTGLVIFRKQLEKAFSGCQHLRNSTKTIQFDPSGNKSVWGQLEPDAGRQHE